MKTYSTSEIAEIIGIHPNTVMLYERWGYIEPVKRAVNGYRIFTEKHLDEIKIVRIALRNELIKSYMRREVVNIIRTVALGELETALELCKNYLIHIQKEKTNEVEAIKKIKKVIIADISEEKLISLNRTRAAHLVGVSINVIINWERNGLIDIPRNKKNTYRVYGEKEIKLLRVIKILKLENYVTQCIRGMVKNIEIYLETGKEESLGDSLLSSLGEAERDIKDLVFLIDELKTKGE